jgi:hypothetical protein
MRRRENGKSFDPIQNSQILCRLDQAVIPSKALAGRFSLFFSTLFLNIDPELLGFLVEMAALQAETFGSICNVVIASLQLGENRFTLEILYPVS